MTEFRGYRDPAMKIGMPIILCMCPAWLQVHPYLKGNLRQRLWHVRFPCKCCTSSPVTLRVCMCYKIHSRVPCTCINPLWLVAVGLGYSRSDTVVGRIHLVCTCKFPLPYYQATLISFNNICSVLMCEYTNDGM